MAAAEGLRSEHQGNAMDEAAVGGGSGDASYLDAADLWVGTAETGEGMRVVRGRRRVVHTWQ